jgi:hypothetical protein
MLRPGDIVLRGLQCGGQSAVLPFVLAAQQRKIELRHLGAAHLVARVFSTSGIGLRQGMAQVLGAGVGVPLDQQQFFGGHGARPFYAKAGCAMVAADGLWGFDLGQSQYSHYVFNSKLCNKNAG